MGTSRRLSRPTTEARLARLASAQHFADLLLGWRSQLFNDVHDPVALFAAHAAEESVGQVLHGGLRGAAQNLKQVRRQLRQLHGFFDEFGKAVFHADTRTKIGRQHRPLPGNALHRDANFVQCAKLLVFAGFRAEADKRRAQKALQFRVGFLSDGFAEFS